MFIFLFLYAVVLGAIALLWAYQEAKMSKHKRGMKTGNFPGKVNDRRKRALARMKGDDSSRAALIAKIVPDYVARGIRSKKDRSAQAKLKGVKQ